MPIGVWIGLRPKATRVAQPIAQFLAAFPANLLFPPFVVAIVYFHVSPNIWLTPLMLIGTQWYILFNVIAGAAAFPGDMKEAVANFRIRGWLWWRKVMIPGILPYFITGAITASRRRLECLHRRRGGELGQPQPARRRGWAPISPRPPLPATRRASCWASP